ncbi:MAG: DUF3995 domain-containing protein [Pseudomonadota bacterium]
MAYLGMGLFAVLTVIAGFHVYWGLGGLGPAASEPELVRTVVGDANGQMMPGRGATLVVAFLVFSAGLVALARNAALPGLIAWIPFLGSWVLSFVFLVRGAFTYLAATGTLAWPYPLAEPFRTLDQMIYAPLCLGIGASFLVLALKGGAASA